MSERTNHLTDLLLELSRAKVRFIVAGGVALVLHGIERMTVDLDIMIDFERENLARFLACVKKIGLVPRAPVSAEVLRDERAIVDLVNNKHALVFTFTDTGNPFRQIDVFLTPDLGYQRYERSVKNIVLGGETIAVLDLPALLELKTKIAEPREKDLFDIKALKTLMGGPRD